MSRPPTEGDDSRGYLDTASGIPPSAPVRQALSAAVAAGWPDPGRRYPDARAARDLLEQSRSSVARFLGVPERGVLFCESPERAVWSALTGHLTQRPALLVSAVEELGIWRACDALAARGTSVTMLPVSTAGRVDPAAVASGVASAPAIVVVQDGNAEIGTRQPLAELRSVVPAECPLVVDARAVLGREEVPAVWDVLVADPRMWGGPPGPALLAVRDPDRFRPDVPRTDGALGVEPTLPDVPAVAAGALALELATRGGPWQVGELSDRLRAAVTGQIPDVEVLGDPAHRLGYLTMFSFLYVAADELVDELARRGWAVASGASCTSDTRRPHHVLVAIGALTHGSLRVSIGPWTTAADLDSFADDLAQVVGRLRADAGAVGL